LPVFIRVPDGKIFRLHDSQAHQVSYETASFSFLGFILSVFYSQNRSKSKSYPHSSFLASNPYPYSLSVLSSLFFSLCPNRLNFTDFGGGKTNPKQSPENHKKTKQKKPRKRKENEE